MIPEAFFRILTANGIVLDEGQRRLFTRYADELRLWNARVNLVSRRDLDRVWEAHMLPSVALLAHTEIAPGARVADIGTGGGLPGIPLKICRPDLHVTLIDSIRKKTEAVAAMLTTLIAEDARVEDTAVVWGRAEELANLPVHHAAYDIVVARAVAPLVDLAAWARPLLRRGGRLLALKGGDLSLEIDHAVRRHHVRASVKSLTLHGYNALVVEAKSLIELTWPE